MDLTNMGAIQLQNPSHATGLLHKANQMRLAGTLCDVVIMVDSQEFHAHRTVLACTSKMFEILFHRNSQHYTLDFLSSKTFQQILEYAYTATLQAKVEDLDDLLYAAEILEIEYLEEQCLKILETIQASDDNDTEVSMADAGTEEDDDRKTRLIKNMLISKHSSEESGYASLANQSLSSSLVEQSPSVSTSFGLSAMSPTKAAVDSLMSIGQSLLQGALQQNAVDLHSTSNNPSGLSDVKPEAMQVDENSSNQGSPSTEPNTPNGDKSDDKTKEAPGTPTRSSVITSARDLNVGRDENVPDQPLERGHGFLLGPEHSFSQAEKHLSLYSVLPNHKADSMINMPPSMATALHMPSALAVSMDFSAYGGLLPQGFIQRELFNKLGELAAGIKNENQSIGVRCSVCGAELPDNEAIEEHRQQDITFGDEWTYPVRADGLLVIFIFICHHLAITSEQDSTVIQLGVILLPFLLPFQLYGLQIAGLEMLWSWCRQEIVSGAALHKVWPVVEQVARFVRPWRRNCSPLKS